MSRIRPGRVLMYVFTLLFFIAFSAGPLPDTAFAAEGYTISGTISLPEGETAGTGGIAVTVEAGSLYYDMGPRLGTQYYKVNVVIPKGSSGTAYSIPVGKPPEGFSYVVSYKIGGDTYKEYIPIAFYCDRFPGQSSQFPIATALDVALHGDFSGIDLGISKYRKVTGTVELPLGNYAPKGGIKVELAIVNAYIWPFSTENYNGNNMNPDDLENSIYASVDCVIPAGGNKANFEFAELSPNERFIGRTEDIGNTRVQSYRLMIRLPKESGYKEYGFYSRSGTVEKYEDSEELNLTTGDRTGLMIAIPAEEAVSDPEKSLDEVLAYLDSIKSIDDTAIDMLKDFRTSLKNAESPEKAVNMAEETIARLPDALRKAASEEYAEELKNIITLIAEKAVEKYGVRKIDAVVSGNTVQAVIDQNKLGEFQSSAEDVVKSTAELEKLLKGSGADEKLETRVTADIQGPDDKKTVNAVISSDVLKMLESKGTDKLEVSSGIASLAFSTTDRSINEGSDKSGNQGDSENLQVSLSRVDNKMELNSSQLKSVKNDPVYDISVFLSKGNVKKSVSSFETPLEIEIPYEIPADANPALITVFYLDGKGNTENMSGYYNSMKKTVTFTTKHLCLFAIKENKVDFKDVSDSASDKVILQQMASQGILSGSDGKFAPEAGITRAQYVQMLEKAFKIGDMFTGPVDCSFSDVKKTDWCYKAVAICVKAGIVKGGSGNRFQPNGKLSRQDLAVITARAATFCKNLVTPSDPVKYMDYTDVLKILQYAKPPVGLVSKYNVMGPKKEKEFKPADAVDRIDAALTIYKLIWVQNPEKNPVRGYKGLMQ